MQTFSPVPLYQLSDIFEISSTERALRKLRDDYPALCTVLKPIFGNYSNISL